jgi:glycosyltransferase involved in cell wall biosynthesis
MAGLGFVFSSTRWQANIIRWFVKFGLRLSLKHPNSRVLLQNPDDQRILVDASVVRAENTIVIRGSGVDTSRFAAYEQPPEPPVVVTLVARMLRDKGIAEFVEAARMLKEQGVPLRAVLVGVPDAENPTSIPESQLKAWSAAGWVEWWGQRQDIPEVWRGSHIAVLPSFYGEGVPLCLIEAAACARPIVTTDIPGCREIVRDGYNGLLVPVHAPEKLAVAIRTLVENRDLRRTMGQRGRVLVEEHFSEKTVVDATMNLYKALLGDRWPAKC